MGENRLQELNKSSDKTSIKSIISNKILIIIIACLFIVTIATLLTVYFIKDQMKDFVTRMYLNQRGPTIHQFHPQIISTEQYKRQTLSNEQTHERLPGNLQLKSTNGGQKRERTSVHTFMNSSNKHQHDSSSDYRHSQSAADLFLYR